MNIGFDTIGNATLICYDGRPILFTDPWVGSPAYYGSWGLAHEIPPAQREAMQKAPYVWISHGHPDHLNQESFSAYRNKKILLPDHKGSRIAQDLICMGCEVTILKDRVWYPLSDNIKILCVSDYNQDAVLLIHIRDHLIINTNDAIDHGWFRFVKKIIQTYDKTFQLSLSGFGDVDMIHLFNENGTFISPLAAKKFPVGKDIALKVRGTGCKYFIPFSSFHRYERSDSVWANEYVTTLSDYETGFKSETTTLLPSFIRWNCETEMYTELKPLPIPLVIREPEVYGDRWSDQLSLEDGKIADRYFSSVHHLSTFLDFITLRVGGKEHTISLSKRYFQRGITFEAPRGSLMNSIEYEIFDDMLIGNFMKTTLHGRWGEDNLYPDFTPYLSKYADNGRAKTKEEVRHYFYEYFRRQPIYFLLHSLDQKSKNIFRHFVSKDSLLYQNVKKTYYFLKHYH